jgi:hypothetical protein
MQVITILKQKIRCAQILAINQTLPSHTRMQNNQTFTFARAYFWGIRPIIRKPHKVCAVILVNPYFIQVHDIIPCFPIRFDLSHKEIKDSIKISKSKLTLTLIDLGYTYIQMGDNRRVLYDQVSNINDRCNYLRKIKSYREAGYDIVYLDEISFIIRCTEVKDTPKALYVLWYTLSNETIGFFVTFSLLRKTNNFFTNFWHSG